MNGGTQANALYNRAIPLDSAIIMSMLIELLNCKPLKCMEIPGFRIEQLIQIVMKRVAPLTEKKILEPLCAAYCLCLYFAMTTHYSRGHTFRFLAMIQTLQTEALVTISNMGGNKIQMLNVFSGLQKNEEIDINYKLEIFSNALSVAKLICRDLYGLMKIVFRVGRRGAHTASFTPDEKRRQLKYSESIQPQALYFMCTFAYSHIAVILHASGNLNLYPGAMESIMIMTLTSTPAECAATDLRSLTANGSSSPRTIIRETIAQVQAERRGEPLEAETEAAAKPVVTVMKLGYDILMETARGLAAFVAHVVCDDRHLQETRLSHKRLCRHFDHPNIVFAQFRTSAVKALLEQDPPSKQENRDGGVVPQPENHSPKQKQTQKQPGSTLMSSEKATTQKLAHSSGAIVDLLKPGYHILHKASRLADWQVNDPAEQDFDYSKRASSPVIKSSRLSADKLSTLGTTQSTLPALPLTGRSNQSQSAAAGYRQQLQTPTGSTSTGRRQSSGRAQGQAATASKASASSVESIADLPLPSGLITGREGTSRSGQRSARGMKSARSASSDGDAYSDTSDSQSNRSDNQSSRRESPRKQKNTNPLALVAQHPGLMRSKMRLGTAGTVGGGAVINMDQIIAGYWALNKIFRPIFVTLDSLQAFPEYHQYFPAEYAPELVEIPVELNLAHWAPSLSSQSMHEASKVIESQYYHCSAAVRLPRILDPTQDAYWICNYLVDFLSRQTTRGGGLHPSTAAELITLKKQFKNMQLHHTTTQSNNNLPRTLPPLLKQSQMHSQSASSVLLLGSPSKQTTTSLGPPKAAKKVRNIQDRLAAAAVAASIESKLFTMEKKFHAELQKVSADGGRAGEEASEVHTSTRPRLFSDLSDMDAAATSKQQQRHEDHSVPSVVWSCEPKQAYLRAAMFTGQDDDDDEMGENPFNDKITKKASAEYAKKIIENQREKAEEEMQFKQYLADQTETILARNRAAKTEKMRIIREQTKEEIMNKTKFKNEWDQLQRKQLQLDKAKAKMEAKAKEDDALKEIMRVQEVKLIHEAHMRQAEIEHKQALKLQEDKIAMLTSIEEVAYIKRQNQEEARMKYLEEQRRAIEDKAVVAEAVKQAKLARKQLRTAETRDKMQARVRMGNFKWHNGEFGFYDAVRAAPVEWVQYEDADGVPYYYDPVSQQSQYRMPVDANIHHYTEDERRDYDALYGEGAYDAFLADKAFKDGVNLNGGYFNEKGLWVEMDGYYDENYEWVPNEGYYDENGKYRKYAKICGDLSFMV